MKYGLKFAPWDQEVDPEEEMTNLLKGFTYVTTAPLYTVVLWVELGQVGMVRRVLEAQGTSTSSVYTGTSQTRIWLAPSRE